jgi:hypothetical protein
VAAAPYPAYRTSYSRWRYTIKLTCAATMRHP